MVRYDVFDLIDLVKLIIFFIFMIGIKFKTCKRVIAQRSSFQIVLVGLIVFNTFGNILMFNTTQIVPIKLFRSRVIKI